MKNIALISILLLSATTIFGQKIKPVWNEETAAITIEGKLYAAMEKKKSKIVTGKDWWITDINDEVVIQFFMESYGVRKRNSKGIMEESTSYRIKVFFTKTGSYVNFSTTPLGMGSKGVMKKLVQNELINEGKLDWEKAVMFIQGNGGRLVEKAKKIMPPSDTPVIVKGREVYQDGVLIGKVNKRVMEEIYVYNIYSVEGLKVMTAKIEAEDPFEWVLLNNNGVESTILYEDDPEGIKLLTYLALNGILHQ